MQYCTSRNRAHADNIIILRIYNLTNFRLEWWVGYVEVLSDTRLFRKRFLSHVLMLTLHSPSRNCCSNSPHQSACVICLNLWCDLINMAPRLCLPHPRPEPHSSDWGGCLKRWHMLCEAIADRAMSKFSLHKIEHLYSSFLNLDHASFLAITLQRSPLSCDE